MPELLPISKALTEGFTRDLLSTTLPKLPPRALANQQNPIKKAWGSQKLAVTKGSDVQEINSLHNDKSAEDVTKVQDDEDDEIDLPKTDLLHPAHADSTIAMALLRIADQLARMILPWQAVICPRAVETLLDLRLNLIQAKQAEFMKKMKSKLEEKVQNFIRKKEEEVDLWLDREIKEWQEYLSYDEVDLSDFLKEDLKRISDRSSAQDIAYRIRELKLTNQLDDHERDRTRDQLVNFRRIVRAAKNGNVINKSIFEQEQTNVEVRVLQDSIAKAQSATQRKIVDMTRSTLRKQEEAHDWLCSLADNALTAAVSEEKLKLLYEGLDQEKNKSMESLQTAVVSYREQHHAILEAITVFAGRIHQHANDYLQREQLILRAFLQYILAIISGKEFPFCCFLSYVF